MEEWNSQIDEQIDYADDKLIEMFRYLKERTKEWKEGRATDILAFEKTQNQQKLFYLNEQTKLQLQESQSMSTQVQQPKETLAKLPRIEIAKFDGQISDWLRFWSQFEENVDKRSVVEVSKLGYLQGYLTPKRRTLITLFSRRIWRGQDHTEKEIRKTSRHREELCERYQQLN